MKNLLTCLLLVIATVSAAKPLVMKSYRRALTLQAESRVKTTRDASSKNEPKRKAMIAARKAARLARKEKREAFARRDALRQELQDAIEVKQK